MTGATVSQTPSALQGRSWLMPHLVLRNFLEESTAAGLLEYAVAHESEFEPTLVGNRQNKRIDPQFRVSVATRRLRQFAPMLRAKLIGLVPELVAAMRSMPLEAPSVELQLVAHNDGAFYRRHIDTETSLDVTRLRVLSGVYYFHAKPRAFTGGALRLFAIHAGPEAAVVDIEPEDNSLVIFHSWAPHEVLPVACPSRRFGDSRFAINCWINRQKAPVDPNAEAPAD